MGRNSSIGDRAAVACASAGVNAPTMPAPEASLLDLYKEKCRRSDDLQSLHRDFTKEDLDWIDEPLDAAWNTEPVTASDWGALILMAFDGGEDVTLGPVAFEWAEKATGMKVRN